MGTSPNDDIQWDALDFSDLPVFETARDLARFSIETHQGHNHLTRTLQSNGFIRLHGHGVSGHQANATSAFTAGIAFQKVITAIGSSLNGAKKSISKFAEQQTQLHLDGSPAPGSIIFNLVAVASPSEELRPNGELFDSSSEMLVDRSFEVLNELFTARDTLQDDQELLSMLEELGPQVSKSLRSFVSIISDRHFDLELKWQQPLAPALHWNVPTLDSERMASFISLHKLDEVPVVLHGRLHTTSLNNSWSLISDEFGRIAIDISEVASTIHRHKFAPGTLVEADAMMAQSDGAGVKTKREFRITRIAIAD